METKFTVDIAPKSTEIYVILDDIPSQLIEAYGITDEDTLNVADVVYCLHHARTAHTTGQQPTLDMRGIDNLVQRRAAATTIELCKRATGGFVICNSYVSEPQAAWAGPEHWYGLCGYYSGVCAATAGAAIYAKILDNGENINYIISTRVTLIEDWDAVSDDQYIHAVDTSSDRGKIIIKVVVEYA